MSLKRHFSAILTMNHFLMKQCVEIVTIYFENSRSVVITQRAYRRQYRGQQALPDNANHLLVSRTQGIV